MKTYTLTIDHKVVDEFEAASTSAAIKRARIALAHARPRAGTRFELASDRLHLRWSRAVAG